MQINSTEAAGLLAFAPAALASAAAALRRPAERKWWLALSLLHALLTLEVLASARHSVDARIREWLRAGGIYFDRRPSQLIAVLIVIALGLVVSRLLVARAPTPPLKIATMAGVGALTVFVLESVSLHYVDSILYTRTGAVLLIAWLWLFAGWTGVAAAVASGARPAR